MIENETKRKTDNEILVIAVRSKRLNIPYFKRTELT